MKEPIDCCDLSLFQMSLLGQGGRGQDVILFTIFLRYDLPTPKLISWELVNLSPLLKCLILCHGVVPILTETYIMFVLSKERLRGWLREGYPCGFSENDSLLLFSEDHQEFWQKTTPCLLVCPSIQILASLY